MTHMKRGVALAASATNAMSGGILLLWHLVVLERKAHKSNQLKR